VSTVIGVDPAFFSGVMRTWLGGTLQTAAGNTFLQFSYNNNPLLGAANMDSAVAALNTTLLTTTGFKEVMGHSQGAALIYKWLREYGPTSTLSTANVRFTTTGCPERKYGGAARVPQRPTFLGRAVSADYGGNGFPDNTPYTVVDIARQYDFWADAPSASVVSTAARNNGNQGQGIHNDYTKVGLSDSDLVTIKTEGPTSNITYKLKRTYPLTSLSWLWWLPTVQASIDASQRPTIEASYSRPITLPW
jgi:hypothetical protein